MLCAEGVTKGNCLISLGNRGVIDSALLES